MVDLETDDSCDDTTHNKFLQGISEMDAKRNNDEIGAASKTNSSSSSESEIELLPNTSNKFSRSLKCLSSIDNQNREVASSTPTSIALKTDEAKMKQSNSSQFKSKITIIDQQDSRKKFQPKNIVHMSSNSDSSSSDEENIITNTSINLNIIGEREKNPSSVGCKLSFDEIISHDENPLDANVREQCSMLNLKREEVIIKNWTPEMYKFYNEINRSDGKKNLITEI